MDEVTSEGSPDLKATELQLERFKVSVEFWKSIIISGFAAVAIALIPPLFQLASAFVEYVKFEHQIKLDEQNKQFDREMDAQKFRSQYVTSFLDKALNQDIELRLRLAEYFKYVAQGDEFRSGWENYYKALQIKRNEIRDEIDQSEHQLSLIQRAPALERDYVEQDRLIQHLIWLRAEVGYVAPDKSVIPDPRTSLLIKPGNAVISLDMVEKTKRPIAQYIIDSFARAGFGTYQQAVALAVAIFESRLDPKAKSGSGNIGLFQFLPQSLGDHYTPSQLEQVDTNVGLEVALAKKYSPFINATNLDDAVNTYVRLVALPSNPNSYVLRVSQIAQTLLSRAE